MNTPLLGTHFSNHLKEWIANIAESEVALPLDDSGLVECIKNAVITHNGELTPNFKYI